jgi:predicted O-methyltransferase YrrM
VIRTEATAAVLDRVREPSPPPIDELEREATAAGVPTVGPDVGRLLRTLAHLRGATRVFEFGSGVGYSAAWLLDALPPDGEIVLTDYDADALDRAAAVLDGVESGATVTTVPGDAVETFRDRDDRFDLVLLDHEKRRYAEAFDLVRDRLRSPGLVVADNVLAGPVDPAAVRDALDGAVADEAAAGIAAYLERIRDAPAVETTVVPLGEGIAVSRVA